MLKSYTIYAHHLLRFHPPSSSISKRTTQSRRIRTLKNIFQRLRLFLFAPLWFFIIHTTPRHLSCVYSIYFSLFVTRLPFLSHSFLPIKFCDDNSKRSLLASRTHDAMIRKCSTLTLFHCSLLVCWWVFWESCRLFDHQTAVPSLLAIAACRSCQRVYVHWRSPQLRLMTRSGLRKTLVEVMLPIWNSRSAKIEYDKLLPDHIR